MINKSLTVAAIVLCSTAAYSEQSPVTGTVQSQCSIITERAGTYGNNTQTDTLSTAPSSGGNPAEIRVDVATGDVYTVKFDLPTSFSSAPSLNDTVSWTGTSSTSQVSNPAMSDYDSTAIDYGMSKEYNLHTAGSVWFEVTSAAVYGVDKPFPAGTYTAMINVACIPK